MEINKPDKGVFKGFGNLQVQRNANKKYFPKIRNIHQFQYTHSHHNDYVTSFQHFFSAKKSMQAYPKEKAKVNRSSLELGSDTNNYFSSVTKADYKHFQRARPPTIMKQKEEGIVLGDPTPPSQHFLTTTIERFGLSNVKENTRVNFTDRTAQRYNPITGEARTLVFGFQDFSMNRNNAYRANNFTYIPQKDQHVDIISGRKIRYK